MPNFLAFADDAVRVVAISHNNGLSPYPDENDDLSSYGPGKSFVRVDHRMRRNGFANNWNQISSDSYPFFGGVPQIAFSAAHMHQGEVLPTVAALSVGIASYPGLSAIISPALRLMLPGFGVAASTLAASMMAVLPAYGIGKLTQSSVRYLNRFGYRLRHIEMGGDYQDTDTAYALRMRSVSEMSSAMSYSRRWLGNEALFMR